MKNLTATVFDNFSRNIVRLFLFVAFMVNRRSGSYINNNADRTLDVFFSRFRVVLLQ